MKRAPFLAAVLVTSLVPRPAHAQSRPDGVHALIFTVKGRIVARLEPVLAPLATANYVGLAEGTIANEAFDTGRPFFDGSTFHRVAPGHVIQGGVPASERARGPGYTFPNEISAQLSHDHAGALNMANGGPGTNASQWCITLGDRSYLDGDYIVFGEVIEGMDVVFAIVQGDRIDSVRIDRIGAAARSYHPDTRSFRALVSTAEARVAEHAEKKRTAERDWIARYRPVLAAQPNGVMTALLAPGAAARPAGRPLRVRYTGTRIRYVGDRLGHQGPPLEETKFGSGSDGIPGFFDPPRVFDWTPGTTTINPGLDSILSLMTPGERRVVVVPAELGYGRNGLYPAETPGQPRFIVSPNTLLAYIIEVLPDGS
jgi:peptidylprolyl isomerase